MEINPQMQPCLVETSQGCSISYNNKFLYSKYNPSKTIIATINNLNILKDSIVLCNSPVLNYGIKELKEKLPENCLMIICEFDEVLRNYELTNTYKDLQEIILTKNELFNFPVILNEKKYTFELSGKTIEAGNYKRVIRIDFSAGVQFHQDLYNQLSEASSNAIKTFWMNRLTITKFGRKYSKNFFTNLKNLPESTPITNYFGKINKSIIICGAGVSLENAFDVIKKNRNDYFVICVDTSLQPLLKSKIIPDAVFIEEAQFIISKAFIGTNNASTHIFAGLSSLPQLSNHIDKNRISYFTTLFTQGDFIKIIRENGILPPENIPLGSVGLTAVYYALKFRKNDEIPVYIYGLDFSYPAGKTHSRGALALNTNEIYSNKLNTINKFTSCYSSTSIRLPENNSQPFYTSQVMLNYSNLFNSLFENEKNLYNSGNKGIKLNIPSCLPEIIKTYDSENNLSTPLPQTKDKIKTYFENEKKELLKLKSLLKGEIKIPAEELETEITSLCLSKEYLYLHFADGWHFQYNQSFLNRISTEIEFFLKIF